MYIEKLNYKKDYVKTGQGVGTNPPLTTYLALIALKYETSAIYEHILRGDQVCLT